MPDCFAIDWGLKPLLASPEGRDIEEGRVIEKKIVMTSPSVPLHGMEREDEEIEANGGPS